MKNNFKINAEFVLSKNFKLGKGCKVENFNLVGDTLDINLNIFEEICPMTVVFKNNDNIIQDVTISLEKIEDGICYCIVHIDYKEKTKIDNKYQEAIDRLKVNHIDICQQLNCEVLQQLVDKQTPKKVKVIDEPDLYYIYYCPNCGSTLMVGRDKCPKHLFNYCGKCGQKLDWDI